MVTRRSVVIGMASGLLTGCATRQFQFSDKHTPVENFSFPYNPLIYHADLSILAYQLYGQSLVWPFDPYYEIAEQSSLGRDRFMQKVRQWVKTSASSHANLSSPLMRLRGPGALNGFPFNPTHDPILYQYGLINPWQDCICFTGQQYVVYKTPKKITHKIKNVYVAARKVDSDYDQISVNLLPNSDTLNPNHSNATDTLLCFEGGTGSKGIKNKPHSQSLMGFVLLRQIENNNYDIHISFRGSRSGSAERALLLALSDDEATGNPDWITDMGYNQLTNKTGGEIVSNLGTVSRGFVQSMTSILPALIACLKQVNQITGGKKPENIYVTGHSLGGALAQHFVSAILQGSHYGPEGQGESMPNNLKRWPWKNLKLITYSAPRAGDKDFAQSLTENALDSEFFSSILVPTDANAWPPNNPEIVKRLLQKDRPAGFRVLISSDPITTEKVAGGKHVGKTVYVDDHYAFPIGADFQAHELVNVRRYIYDLLKDKRIPKEAWEYKSLDNFGLKWEEDEAGTKAGYTKLANSISNYYLRSDIAFNHKEFEKNKAVFLSFLEK